MEKCRNGELNLPRNLNGNARNLIKQILVEDPEQRLTISQIKQHPFFKGTDWKKLLSRTVKPPYLPDKSMMNPDRYNDIENRPYMSAYFDNDDESKIDCGTGGTQSI